MAKDYDLLAKGIVEKVGGEANIISLAHCMTRLRFKLKDESAAKTDEITNMNGVLKVMQAGGQYQVVIGTDVEEVYDRILASTKINAGGVVPEDKENTGENKGIGAALVDVISGIFTPFIGAFTASGLLKGFVVLFTTLGWLDTTGTTYTILYAASDGVFYFLPIFLAHTAGKKFGAKPYVSMAIAAALVYPSITALFNVMEPIDVSFLGIPVQMINYTSSVLPIIAACYVQAKLEKLLYRIIPKLVQGVFVPVLTLVIILPLTLIVVGHVTNTIGNAISVIIEAGIQVFPPLAGFVFAGLWPVMIMFGIHWAFIPIAINNMAVLGYDYLMPITVGCNFGIAAASLAIFLKTRKNDVREVAAPATISALIGGVTEPAVYGLLLKYRVPMVIVCLVNGVGGAICAAFNVTRNVQMSVNLLTLPAIWAVYGSWGIAAIAVSFVGCFIFTWLFGYNDKMNAD